MLKRLLHSILFFLKMPTMPSRRKTQQQTPTVKNMVSRCFHFHTPLCNVFIFSDSKSSLEEDTAVVYGQEDCCFIYNLMSGVVSYPENYTTSNCTVQPSISSSYIVLVQTDIHFVLFCSLLSSVFFNCCSLYNSIGLT